MKFHKTTSLIFVLSVMTILGLVVMSQKPAEVMPVKQWAGSLVLRGDIYRLGNVGIGTAASDSFKLAVDGRIGAREIIVHNDEWADFVFDPNYPLMSLAEVEMFYQKNKHLPGVPSSGKVKQEGVKLGQMNAILLQKIEELTLYVVQLKKENQILKERVNAMEK